MQNCKRKLELKNLKKRGKDVGLILSINQNKIINKNEKKIKKLKISHLTKWENLQN